MDDKKMKETWRRRPCSDARCLIEEARSKEILTFRRKTALQRLADRYRVFYTVAFCMIPANILFLRNIFDGYDTNYALMYAFALYFLTAGCMDVYLHMRIRRIDVLEMPTSEVIREALDCRKWHLRFMMILLPAAIALIVMMAMCFDTDKYVIYGMLTGGACGIAIGLKAFSDFMNDYRQLRD